MIRYAKTHYTYALFLKRDKLLTNKLNKQGSQQSWLRSSFRKFCGRYNNSVSNLPLGRMLNDVFVYQFFSFPNYDKLRANGGCERSAGGVHFPIASGPTPYFCWGPCLLCSCFEYFIWTFDYEYCSLSLHLMFHVAVMLLIYF